MKNNKTMKNYLTAEEFDLMTELELDTYFDDDFQFQEWKEDQRLEAYQLEKEAMETDYQYCK